LLLPVAETRALRQNVPHGPDKVSAALEQLLSFQQLACGVWLALWESNTPKREGPGQTQSGLRIAPIGGALDLPFFPQ